jgi:L-fucose isomerase-like protein
MALAHAVADLISSNLRNGDGSPVECVIADSTIGRVAETVACQEKFEREGVGATITVTSCWCYGSETMDMHPHWPKAVWGFNGTERPGAVYLVAVLAAHAQKGLPAFGIYGHIGADLITLASMLRIPVCMHNVPDDQIFRPAAWNAFGMDKEGADFRACKNFGPTYK